ncbi:MAG TPA: mandelate racemase/muconate lactonizing enzyme family protein [Syntrophorhabdales bacterium]|nr:mandelate racemase/muconate lactonizing enzyme family protein [Syntrophorhabdales bacterium]
MKITGVELIPLTMYFKSVIEESFGTVGKREDDVVVRIHTDEGITGLGEGPTLGPFYSGESQETVMGIIAHHLFPKVLEGKDPFDIDPIHFQMEKVVYRNTVAKAAIDWALHDIMGKALNVPLYKLLGGKFTDEIPLRGSVGIDTPQKMAENAKRITDEGFKAIKMKVGLEPIMDVDRVKAIRAVVPADIIINIDVNGAYAPKDAIWMLQHVSEYVPITVEQPVRRDDLEGLALVKKCVNVPIGACESALTLPEVSRVIQQGAADFFNFKIDRSGGFYPGKIAVKMIEAAGLFVIASEQLGFGIEVAGQAHFGVSTQGMKWPGGYAAGLIGMAGKLDTVGFEGDIVDKTPVVKNGKLRVPEGPGLGVQLVEEKWRRYLTPGKEIIKLGRIS